MAFNPVVVIASVAKHSRRGLLAAAFALGALLASQPQPARAAADNYPNRPVTIIVPFSAGGSGDVYARLLAPQLQQELGQPFIVEDHPGAGSLIGTEVAKSSPNDGYWLMMVSNTQTVNETLFPRKKFKLMRDFVSIAPVNSADLVLVTRPDLGVHSVAELIKLAKSKPGILTFSTSGPGTPYHMAGELFNQMAGVDVLHVPYKLSSAARIDVIAGQVDMMFDATTTMDGFVTSGKVVAIATTGLKKSDVLPNLPTVAETLPGYEALLWLGVMAPAGTPDDIVRKLNATIAKIVQKPAVVEAWRKQGADPMVMSPEKFKDFLNADIEKWAKVVKFANIRPGQ
jgi:tripartite-type tricarboxylate transporter receptor subunit TctC